MWGNSFLDKKSFKRLQDIEKLLPEDREHIFALMDAFLSSAKYRTHSVFKTLKPGIAGLLISI